MCGPRERRGEFLRRSAIQQPDPFRCTRGPERALPGREVVPMATRIRPLADRLIVKRVDEQEQKSAGGIIIPDTAKEKPQEGKVVAVGRGKLNDDSKLIPLE